jgi:hypothetical protein
MKCFEGINEAGIPLLDLFYFFSGCLFCLNGGSFILFYFKCQLILGFGVWGLGFGVWGLGFGVWVIKIILN